MAVTLSGTPLFCAIVAVGLLIGWLFVRPRYWRAEPSTLDSSPPLWWFLSEDAWRGFLRSSSATVPLIVLVLLFGSLVMVFGEKSTAAAIFGLAGAVLLIVIYLLAVSITLWNRPRFVVPPALRSHPGSRAQRRTRELREQRQRRER